MLEESILTKQGLRSDRIWSTPLLAHELPWRVPLALDTLVLLMSQYWPRARMDALVASRLDAVFAHARTIPFWRDRFAESGTASPHAADITRLQTYARRTLIPHPHEYYTDARRFMTSTADFTSGSTGTPFQFYFDRGAILRSYAMNERHFRVVGSGTRHPVVSLRGRPKIGFTFVQSYHFYARGAYGVRARLPAFKTFMQTMSPCILYSFPSFLLELARAAEEERLRFPLVSIISSGEGMKPSERAYVESILGAQISNCYGTRELGALGFECNERRIHLNEEWAFFEILDDMGRVLPEGVEGRIVVTTFDNLVMPFILYETADRGTITQEACPCGRTLRTISLKGRETDRIALKDGRTVTLLEISPIFDAYWEAVHGYQIVRRSDVSFVVRVIPGPKFGALSMALRFHLMHALHSQASVDWETVESLEPSSTGKAVYYIDETRGL